jgi:hypothetical protein
MGKLLHDNSHCSRRTKTGGLSHRFSVEEHTNSSYTAFRKHYPSPTNMISTCEHIFLCVITGSRLRRRTMLSSLIFFIFFRLMVIACTDFLSSFQMCRNPFEFEITLHRVTPVEKHCHTEDLERDSDNDGCTVLRKQVL